jgi:hypothetical protein
MKVINVVLGEITTFFYCDPFEGPLFMVLKYSFIFTAHRRVIDKLLNIKFD